MYLNNEVNALYEKMRSDKRLENYKIIMAYPYALKPTRMSNQIIVLSPSGIQADSTGLGNDEYYGNYSIDIDAFSSFDLGSPVMSEIIENILEVAVDPTVTGIKVGPVSHDRNSRCFSVKCTLTYCYSLMRKEDE